MNINATILGEMITFILLVIFTMKFVWPPINDMLDKRASQIADGLSAAEKGKQHLLDAEANIAAELKKIQARAGEIIANAEKRSNQIIEDSKERARHESDKIITDAKAQLAEGAIIGIGSLIGVYFGIKVKDMTKATSYKKYVLLLNIFVLIIMIYKTF